MTVPALDFWIASFDAERLEALLYAMAFIVEAPLMFGFVYLLKHWEDPHV